MTPTPRDRGDEATASALRRALNEEANQILPTDRWSEIESELAVGNRRWNRWAAPFTVAAAAGTIAVLVWTTTSTQAGPHDVGPAGTATSTVSVSPDRSVPEETQDSEQGADPASEPSGRPPAASRTPEAANRSPQAGPDSATAQSEAAQAYPGSGEPAGETDAPAASVPSPSEASGPGRSLSPPDGVEVPKLTSTRPDAQSQRSAAPATDAGDRAWDTASDKPPATYGSGTRTPVASAKSGTIELKAPSAPVLERDNVRIVGGASVFEAALSWQLSDEDGPIASGFETATKGAPDWGTFAIELGTLDRGHYTVLVWSDDPQGGSALSQAMVAFTVG